MKTALRITILALITLLLFTSCHSSDPKAAASPTEIAYLYVSAVGESGLIGSGTIRVDGKQMDVFVPLSNAHETYRLYDTVRIEYDPAMLLAESGTVSMKNNFSEPPSPTTHYEMRLTAVINARHTDPAKGEPLYG